MCLPINNIIIEYTTPNNPHNERKALKNSQNSPKAAPKSLTKISLRFGNSKFSLAILISS